MLLIPVADQLNEFGLAGPTLELLLPTQDNYSVALLQPKGQIKATSAGVFGREREQSEAIFTAFLKVSSTEHLVVTPEYSMPWQVLKTALFNSRTPEKRALWAFGCESIRYSELQAFREELNAVAEVIFEPLEPDDSRFVDPLAYVFWSADVATGTDRLVVLIQFKTVPFGDDEHFELNHLQRGSRVYVFGEQATQIRLLSLICSDSFGFTDQMSLQVFDRTIVLHLQLNPKPRQSQYRMYRNLLFRYANHETELICLNWAEDVEEWGDGEKVSAWGKMGGTAWYLQPDSFDDTDETLLKNHRRGLYYTWFDDIRSHALFFSYSACIFKIVASKVAHLGVPRALSRKRGPKVTDLLLWDDSESAWKGTDSVDDGFLALCAQFGCQEKLRRSGVEHPLRAERVFALGCGAISGKDWFRPQKIDAFNVGASEAVRRMTACMDVDATAVQFRTSRIGRLTWLEKILEGDEIPPAYRWMKAGWRFDWSPASPHTNLTDASGSIRATAVYMGEESTPGQVQQVKATLANYLHQGSADADASINARQQLVVWFRDSVGKVQIFEADRYNQIDGTGESEVDFSRGE